MDHLIRIPCLCACCGDDLCFGQTVLEPGAAPDRCVLCEAKSGCSEGFMSESEALDLLHALKLSPEEHAVAVDALDLRYRPGAPVDLEHEARVLTLVGMG